MSLNNPWVFAGVAVAIYAAWELGSRRGFGMGRTSALLEYQAGAKARGQRVDTAYDPAALTATVSSAGTSGMTIASNPAISSINTNGAAYNV